MFVANQIRLTNSLRVTKEIPDCIYEVIKTLYQKVLQTHQKDSSFINMLISKVEHEGFMCVSMCKGRGKMCFSLRLSFKQWRE